MIFRNPCCGVEKGYTEGKTVTVIETSKENPDYTIVMIDESYFARSADYDGEKWSDCRTVVRCARKR